MDSQELSAFASDMRIIRIIIACVMVLLRVARRIGEISLRFW